MLKLGVLVTFVLAAAAAAAWVPVHGRTVLDRWNAASGPAAFLLRGWAEVSASLAERERTEAAARPRQAGRVPDASARATRRAAPVEHHDDADRAALDRIVAEHASR